MLKNKIIFLGPLPPPYMGPTLASKIILNSKLIDEFNIIHLDTSDHRDLNKLGVINFYNIYLAFKHYCILIWLIIKHWPVLVYIPISQTTIGYIRDAFFILISKLLSRKVICHLRGGNFRNWYKSSNAVVKWLVRHIHSIINGQIVLGENLRHMFNGIVPARKIFVVPNGRNFEFDFYKEKRSNNTRILYLSNFIRTKGALDVLKAVADVYNKNPDIEFIFAGNLSNKGVKKGELTSKQEFKNFLRDNPELPIILKGPVYDQTKYELLSTADIFVFPTYYPAEGHPWVVVEAMAAGLPIITTDKGAITESVKNGVNGFIIDKKSPKKIAEKINILIENPMLRRKMGEASRRIYLENYTEEKMIERLSNAFHSVLKD